MSTPSEVLILMGSPNDLDTMRKAHSALLELGVTAEMHVSSAHRDPERVEALVTAAEQGGRTRAIICGAGMAAHLAGAVSARTVLPVIGVPLSSSPLGGNDALYSTVQMPRGIPVATVAIDGAANAGILAAQIVALGRPEVAEALRAQRRKGRDEARAVSAKLQDAAPK
jgi:5-(carboxyamino)imidazole ribonucleotide mutase